LAGACLGPRVFRPWRSFPTMVASGFILGFLTGGFPDRAREISQLALIVATTFALTEISFRGISLGKELRWFLLPLTMNYVVLGVPILAFASLTVERTIHDGWVLMAAVPPAIAVVPITAYIRGNTRRTLISLALLYLFGLFLVPGLTFAFTHETVPLLGLVVQTVLLVGVPIAASRPVRRWSKINAHRASAVSFSFFFLVFAVSGSARGTLLSRPDLLVTLSVFSIFRTFGIGLATFLLARRIHLSRDDRIAVTAFGSFKNLGLAIVLAFSIFGPEATLPSIVSLVFEIGWLATLPILFRSEVATPSPKDRPAS
jgi:bile acid:Na+ symporter, BASS family